MYREGGIIGKSNTPTISTASGTWKINEVRNAEADGIFPVYTPVEVTASLNTITAVPINIDYTTVNADDNRKFDIVDVNFTSGATAGHTFYFNCRPRGPTTYYNDFCLGAFQIIRATDMYLIEAKGHSDTTDLQTSTVSSAYSDPTSQYVSYSDVATGSTGARWNVASGTGSNRTGAQGGVHNLLSDDSSQDNLMQAPGIGLQFQFSNLNYIYLESSSPTSSGQYSNNHHLKLNSSISLTTNTAHKVRICYHFTTSVGQSALFNNIFYIYIEN